MRLGELEGTIAEENGYGAEYEAEQLLEGLGMPASRAGAAAQGVDRRHAPAGAAGPGAVRHAGHPAARRADQPPRPRVDPLAVELPDGVPRRAGRDLARSLLLERGLHAHGRRRLPEHHHVHGRLRRDDEAEDPVPDLGGEGQREQAEEDLRAQGVHPALRGQRQEGQPGAVAAARDHQDRPGRPQALEHPAAVHPLRPQDAERQAGAGGRQAEQELREAGAGQPDLQRDARREDRGGRAPTGSARRRCSSAWRGSTSPTAARSCRGTRSCSGTCRRTTRRASARPTT
jgi:hypothetical protein